MKFLSETSIIRLMSLVRRVALKFDTGLYCVQKMLSLALPSRVNVISGPVRLAGHLADNDLSPLFAMLPAGRHYGSSICENDLSHKDDYDLEVIIPAYNVEKYLEKCFDSVVSQKTKYSFLIVVVNDGSTDRTHEILAKYNNRPNIEIIEQKNRGLSGARNAALKHIRGRYITFVDSDDWLFPGAIEKMMDVATENDADIVEGCFKLFDGEKLLPGYSHRLEIADCCHGQLQGYSCGKVIRSEMFATACFPEGYLYEDTLMTLVIYSRCRRIVTIPDCVYVYRVNMNGITATSGKSPRAVESLLVTMQLLEDNAVSKQLPDIQAYNNFLKNEVPNTFLTIYNLNSVSVNHHVFSVFCRLTKQYFDGFRTSEDDLKQYEKALLNEDYRAYVLAIMMRKN